MSHGHELPIDSETRATLQRYGFNEAVFTQLREELAHGKFPPERNRLQQPVAPLQPGDTTPWPEGEQRAALEARGRQAIAAGKVAVLILNGGMATRFGGVVKGVVEVWEGKSFLALRLEQIAKCQGPVPVFLMNSFATEEATAQHLAQGRNFGIPSERLHTLVQRISIRLTPSGELFRLASNQVSLYAPGHGDVLEVLAESPDFQRWRDAGGEAVMVGNVDNLGATLDPVVVGAHLAGERDVTVEVAPRAKGDKGGAPARVGDRVEIVEGFRFPPDFDIEQIPVFNTNTLTLGVKAVRNDHPLTWFRVDKEVDGQPVVQFERLIGEVTSFVGATYLEVPRQGPHNRFMPVKTPDDLSSIRDEAQARLGYIK